MKFKIKVKNNIKTLTSPNYNYRFDMKNGDFYEWGATEDNDPNICPFGAHILDIEITTVCAGIKTGKNSQKTPCSFCYKSNTANGINMTFKDFKKILNNTAKSKINGHFVVTQVAFGVDASAESNPDLIKMMKYCRKNSIIPNLTVADVTQETAKKLISVVGAVAVSFVPVKNTKYYKKI